MRFIGHFLLVLLILGSVNSSKANMLNNLSKNPTKTSEPHKMMLDSVEVVTPSKIVTIENKKKATVSLNKDNLQRIKPENPQVNKIASKYADILAVATDMVSNLSLYSFIESWVGTRYVFGGTSHRGIDCSAFVRELYSSVFHLDLMRTSILQYAACQRIGKTNELKEGDLVFFNTLGRGVSHVGVYLQNNRFVHSSSSKGVGVSTLTGYWSSKFITGGRIL